MARMLIRNATILTMDPRLGDLAGGDLMIEDGRIAAVGRDLKAQDAEIIDGERLIVLPGLINAHLHTWETGLRGIGGTWLAPDYHKNMHGNMTSKFSAEDTYLATLLGALGQINAGTTTLMDWCHNNSTPAHTDSAIDALFEAGIRSVFGHGTVKPPQKEGEPHYSEIPHPRSEIERLRKGRLCQDRSLVTLAMAILGPEFSTTQVTLADFRLAREMGLMSSSHVWNRPGKISPDGFYPVIEAGLLGPDHNVVHGNFVPDEELRAMVEAGASFTVTPAVELQTSPTVTLIGRLLALGKKPSLGADAEIFVAGDMFHVMRFALQAQRIFDNQDCGRAGRPVETLLSPRQVLEWATIEGARALMMEDNIGSLTPGKQADLICIAADHINLAPINDPVQAVVLYAERSDVESVMIGGEWLSAMGGWPTRPKTSRPSAKAWPRR